MYSIVNCKAKAMATNSTHMITFDGDIVLKRIKRKQTYLRERDILKKLNEHGCQNIVEYRGCDDVKNTILMTRVNPGVTLEYVMSQQVFHLYTRRDIWAQIWTALSHINTLGVKHGDFKAKNILMDEDDIPYICDFDLGAFSSQVSDDYQKAKILYYQLFCIREGDTHHWPYHNSDKKYRNGEQIHMLTGPELAKDIANLRV